MADHKKKIEDPASESLKRKHETTDVDFKQLMVTGFGLLGIMIAGLAISWALYVLMKGNTPEPGMNPITFVSQEEKASKPIPQLQPSPRDSLAIFRMAEDSILTGYGWTNRDSGLARVPIERAKELMLKRGLPYDPEGRK